MQRKQDFDGRIQGKDDHCNLPGFPCSIATKRLPSAINRTSLRAPQIIPAAGRRKLFGHTSPPGTGFPTSHGLRNKSIQTGLFRGLTGDEPRRRKWRRSVLVLLAPRPRGTIKESWVASCVVQKVQRESPAPDGDHLPRSKITFPLSV